MIQDYKGHYDYDKSVIEQWNNSQGGVYYLGTKNAQGILVVFYIGKAFGDGGIRQRLLQHLNENKWGDVTHFGYCVCSSEQEALNHEAQEIKLYNPKYNTLLKRY